MNISKAPTFMTWAGLLRRQQCALKDFNETKIDHIFDAYGIHIAITDESPAKVGNTLAQYDRAYCKVSHVRDIIFCI